MDDTTRSGSTFIDDELDFDLGFLDADEDAAEADTGRRMLKSRPKDRYKPRRFSTPNWSRIGTALFVAGVALLVVVFAVNAIIDHRRTSQVEDYMRSVDRVAAESDRVGVELSNLLSQPTGADRAQLIGRIDKLAAQSQKLVTDMQEIDAPESLQGTHAWAVTSLEYRKNGLVSLRKAMTGALRTTDRAAAAQSVAAANWRLQASDVIWNDSYVSNARQVLRDEDITGVKVAESHFTTDPEFGSPKSMALMLGRLTSGGNGKAKDPKDGLVHGGQLSSVMVSPAGVTLSPDSLNEVASSEDLAFEISYFNQGEGQETQIPVTITLKGETAEPLEIQSTIEKVDPGQTISVKVPLEEMPPFGETLMVTVEIGAVPGEKTTSNNSAQYQVRFSVN